MSNSFKTLASLVSVAALFYGCGDAEKAPAAPPGKLAPAVAQPAAPTSFVFPDKFQYLASMTPADVQGDWKVGVDTARISVAENGQVKVTNERNVTVDGKLTGQQIEAWGIGGKVTADKKLLVWSNGSVWSR